MGGSSRLTSGFGTTQPGASALLASQPSDKLPEAERKIIERNFDLLQLRFEPNQGQSSSDAKFLAQGRGFSALFKENEADFLLVGHSATSGPLRVTLVNASRHAAISGENRLPGTVNYFIGDDREKWHTGLPTFECLRYTSVYPGTDLIYYGNKGSLEFDFRMSPGADPSQIQMRFEGERGLRINGKGDLVVTAKDGHISFQKPVIYQPAEGGKKDIVAGYFKILKGDTVGFADQSNCARHHGERLFDGEHPGHEFSHDARRVQCGRTHQDDCRIELRIHCKVEPDRVGAGLFHLSRREPDGCRIWNRGGQRRRSLRWRQHNFQ